MTRHIQTEESVSSIHFFYKYCFARILGNKFTQMDNADSEVQFITLAGPRQSLLLAKDPEQFL